MKAIVLNIAFLFMLNIVGFTQEVNSCYTEISCKDFHLMMETKNPMIIDVRLYKDYRKERIYDSHIATEKTALKELLKNVRKETDILVYCSKGERSRVAAEIICKEMKFKNVYSLEKGINEWKRKGYQTESSELKSSEY